MISMLFVFIFWSYTHDTFDCINSSKYVILVEKCVNLKLKWMKNYDTKKKKKVSLHASCDESSIILIGCILK